jgi:NAD(P)-dependent dehydrogenase (short-subunit alcohol dehydrogenase family)
MVRQKTILITGASTGIGREAALQLAGLNYRVFAGVRRQADVEALRAKALPTLFPVVLDVTSDHDIERIGTMFDAEESGLQCLINNAGHNFNSAFEYFDDAKARGLMEVNFFGLARLSRRLIPALRRGALKGDTAKLVNVSSVGGSFGLAWEVFYHASKFAVIGLSEGLRQELWKQHIRVVVVQPGGIRTEFMPKTAASIDEAIATMPEEGKTRYSAGLARLRSQIDLSGRFGSSPSAVARVLKSIVAQRNPRFRWFVGLDARLLYGMHRVMPFSWTHALFRFLFGA